MWWQQRIDVTSLVSERCSNSRAHTSQNQRSRFAVAAFQRFLEIPYLTTTFNYRMYLTVSAKHLGQKRPLISNKIIEINDIGPNPTVQCLIEAVVDQQVREYNSKPLERSLLSFMDQETIDDAARTGKVGFGTIYNESKADPVAAKQTALRAFLDGLFVLFADDREFTDINEIITIHPTTVITFIRLTFLAGGYW